MFNKDLLIHDPVYRRLIHSGVNASWLVFTRGDAVCVTDSN